MDYPNDLKYTSDHVWVQIEGMTVLVGITDYAQDILGDILYVDLPAEGDIFAGGEVFAQVESNKTTSELSVPFAGEVVQVNEELDDMPQLINDDPYGAWIVELKVEDMAVLDLLMSAADYEDSLE